MNTGRPLSVVLRALTAPVSLVPGHLGGRTIRVPSTVDLFGGCTLSLVSAIAL